MPEQTEYSYDVFISYSHTDRSWVWETLLPRLEEAGLIVCIDDRDFAIGVPVLRNIERAVDSSSHTLIVLTPAWAENEWTEFESLLAGTADPAGRRQRLMPIMLNSCALPTRIAALTLADLTEPDQQTIQFNRLIQQLQANPAAAKPPAKDISPFIAGPPIVHPQHFFGRERELKRLFNFLRTQPLQNAAIIGPRRSGKTSLLQYLKTITRTSPEHLRPGQRTDWLSMPERYRWILVDFQDPRVGYREGLLRYLLNSLGLSTPITYNLDHFLDLLTRHLRMPTVILMDELGVALQRCPDLDNTFWEGLRALATTQVDGNLAFVMAAHESPDQLAYHTEHSSPFFNIIGYTATLGPLTEPEARMLIASAPISFPEADIDWILAESERWPILLQILCNERLTALEEGETSQVWQEEGRRQMVPFRHLLSRE